MGAVMSAITGAIGALFKRHKLKAASIFFFAFLTAFLIFPYGDLSDVLSGTISKATGGSVFIDMDSISLGLFPGPGVSLEKVSVETTSMPTISVASLTIMPSLLSTLTSRWPQGSIRATGLMKGKGIVEASYGLGEKTKSGERMQVINTSLETFGLGSLNEFLRSMPLGSGNDPASAMLGPIISNLNLRGTVSGTLRGSFDPRFETNPSGAFDLAINGFALNLSSLLGMDLSFEKTQFVGRLADGKLQIEKADLGSVKDEINAKIKGSMDLPVGGGRITPGAYDLNVTLNASDAAVKKLGFFLDSITAQGGKYEKTATGMTYRFRALPGNGGLPRYLPAE